MLAKLIDYLGQTHIINTTHIYSIAVKNSESNKLIYVFWDNGTKTAYCVRPTEYSTFINSILKEDK
jgi:hypothetical protein